MLHKHYFTPLLLLLSSLAAAQNVQWELRSPTAVFSPYDLSVSVKADGNGNLFTLSYFKEDITINGTTIHPVGSDNDLLLVKYNADRAVEWYKAIRLKTTTNYLGFALDHDDNLLIASATEDTIFLDNIILPPQLEKAGFVAKISNAGVTQWVRQILDGGYPFIHKLSLDKNNNIFISGESWQGGFFAKLDPLGNTIWKREMNNPSSGNNVWGSDIKVAPDGSVYGIVLFQLQQMNISDSLILYNPYSFGAQMVLLKYDPNGELLWYSQNTQGMFLKDPQMVIDQSSNVYVSGNFYGAPLQLGDLDPIPGSNNTAGFIARCNADKQWQWVKTREPWPDLSYNMVYDCQHEKIYSTTFQGVEVHATNGDLVKQFLVETDNTKCFSLDIGKDDNLLIAGVSSVSLVFGNNFGWNNPFIASLDYNTPIEKTPCASTPVHEPFSGNYGIMVFPTLVSDVVTVALNAPVSEATVLISDAQGKKLTSRHFSGQPSTQFDLDLAAFPPGIMLLSVQTEGNVQSFKIIKL